MKKIVIAIPAFRPDKSLVQLIEALSAYEVKIVLVNDGSGQTFDALFRTIETLNNTAVLSHPHNRGKGEALKTAFAHILKQHPDTAGVVTADADGQHLAKDILAVANQLVKQPTHLIMGVRQFQGKVPLRSSIGNSLTRSVFALLLGKVLTDTQTGLRGIPLKLVQACLSIPSSGYEFELEMLILAVNAHIPINQCPIETVYENNNACSHFNPLRDSIKIYLVFVRFAAIGAITAAIDFSIFLLCYYLSHNLLLSEGLARASGGLFSFFSSKHWVFKSPKSITSELIKYTTLWLVLLSISYSLLYLAISKLGMNPYLSKIAIQLLLFVISFSLQRFFVFSHQSKRSIKTQIKG